MTLENKAETICRLLDNGNKAVILYGVPGTQKSQLAMITACQELGITMKELPRMRFEPIGITNEKGCWEIISMHEGYTYDNFIGISMPSATSTNPNNSFRRGIFTSLCKKAAEMRDLRVRKEGAHKFIIIIKDINKVDITKVFGELLPAIGHREMPVATPYVRSLSVPDNVYIIATVDGDTTRCIGNQPDVFKTFSFYHVTPMLESLNTMLSGMNIPEADIADYMARCKSLNDSLSMLSEETSRHIKCEIGEEFFAKIASFMVKPGYQTKVVNNITSETRELLWDNYIDALIFNTLGADSYNEVYSTIADLRELFVAK